MALTPVMRHSNRSGTAGVAEALDFAYLLSTTLEGPFRGAGFRSSYVQD
jgi:hypothetical protein